MDVNEGIIPYRKAAGESDLEEERRLLYVGMTRARKELSLFYVGERHEKKLEPSRFLLGIWSGRKERRTVKRGIIYLYAGKIEEWTKDWKEEKNREEHMRAGCFSFGTSGTGI